MKNSLLLTVLLTSVVHVYADERAKTESQISPMTEANSHTLADGIYVSDSGGASNLTVGNGFAQLEFPCSRAEFPLSQLDEKQAFKFNGWTESIMKTVPPRPKKPVTVEGSVSADGNEVRLVFTYDGGPLDGSGKPLKQTYTYKKSRGRLMFHHCL
jgi:hypothetical protein